MTKYITTYYSDIGIKKSTNQDSLMIKEADTSIGKVLLAIVCDGMGGLAKGEVASASVIKLFDVWFENELPEMMRKEDFSLRDVIKKFETLIREKNTRILQYGRQNNINLGTTISAIFMLDDYYCFFHVGDSRIYIMNHDELKQITHDQTLVQKEVDDGIITYEQSLNDPRSSILLQCVGASRIVEPEVGYGKIKNEDIILLCSDGFRHKITSQDMFNTLKAKMDERSLRSSLYYLTEKSKELYEEDNISALVIRIIKENVYGANR